MSRYHNPYQTTELRAPKIYEEEIRRYTLRIMEGGKKYPSKSPFPRMVDIWFLALCLGSLKNPARRKKLSQKETFKFIEGTIFQSDAWRVDLISLLVVAYSEDVKILEDPKKVIQLCNELAAIGFPEVFEMLESGKSEPIWNISDEIFLLLNSEEKSINN